MLVKIVINTSIYIYKVISMKNSVIDKRSKHTVKASFVEDLAENLALFLTSPTDIGVRRNKGRNGARFAPLAIMNVLKKFNNHDESLKLKEVCVSFEKDEKENFEKAQNISSELIGQSIQNSSARKVVHIGGGHDHVYPLLKSLDSLKQFNNILIINIDAHCDTRVDDINHSGTPFRDYSKIATKPFHLIQYGIQKLANSTQTLSELGRGTQEKVFMHTLEQKSDGFKIIPKDFLVSCPFEIDNKTLILLSLDCDAIDGSQMKGVSAVNPDGIPYKHVKNLITHINKLHQNVYLGIYEYNPVYDDLSQLGARSLSSLIYDYLYK